MLATNLTFGKAITYIVFAIVFAGLVFQIIGSAFLWFSTGNSRPFLDNTLGQIVYWDTVLYQSIQTLKDPKLMNEVPEMVQSQYKQFVVNQIVFSISVFALLGFILYKFGNWIMGEAAFNPSTDLILIGIIFLLIFPMAEFGYGYLVHSEKTVPYRGVIELFKPSTWKVLTSEGTLTSITMPYTSNMANYTGVS